MSRTAIELITLDLDLTTRQLEEARQQFAKDRFANVPAPYLAILAGRVGRTYDRSRFASRRARAHSTLIEIEGTRRSRQRLRLAQESYDLVLEMLAKEQQAQAAEEAARVAAQRRAEAKRAAEDARAEAERAANERVTARSTYIAKRNAFNSIRNKIGPVLLERDGDLCAYWSHCKTTLHSFNATVDHIVPLIKGGENEMDNYQLLCHSCNAKKGGRLESELSWIPTDRRGAYYPVAV